MGDLEVIATTVTTLTVLGLVGLYMGGDAILNYLAQKHKIKARQEADKAENARLSALEKLTETYAGKMTPAEFRDYAVSLGLTKQR
jgi:hypothetical protein